MRRKRLLIILPILVLLLATALRFYRLDAQSFWNDEGNSARLSERSLTLIIEGTASDIHPPLYYLMLAGWRRLLGDSEFSLRALSAFAGVAVVAATYAVGRAGRLRQWQATLAALLAALNPALVYYSQEARMYELLALWAVLSTLLLLRLLPRLPTGASRNLWMLAGAYVLVSAAGLYTHYFFPAVLFAQLLIVVSWQLADHFSQPEAVVERLRRAVSGVLRWALLAGAAALLYLPWVPIFLRQAGGRAGDEVRVAHFVGDAARWLLLGAPGQEAPVAILLAAAALGLLALVVALWQPWHPAGRLPAAIPAALLALVPVGFMAAVGTTRPAYFKFMSVSVPFLALLLAAGVVAAWRIASVAGRGRVAVRFVALALVLLVVHSSARALQDLYFDPAYARADYRGIAQRIAGAGHPNAGIVLNAANQWEVFTYYHRQGAPVYPIPRGQPQAGEIAGELSQIAVRHDRIYALYWGEAERDPQRLVENWLDRHAFKATEEWVGDVRFVTYAAPPEPGMEMQQPAGATFGRAVALDGYTLGQTELAPGDIAQVTLLWRAAVPIEVRYKVFLHLLDGEGRLVAQRDAEPGGGALLTTGWQPGQRVIDNHGLFVPLQTAPGNYDLYLGLYPLDDPAARLPVVIEGGSESDTYHLGTLSVETPNSEAEPGP
ncbi:MAG TPA: glycosyltransferase family 39 protein [Candidatus Sulfomarinibacteraceae bacterium]|nr:glycosyltransferase family 39 protein [Candidatus Sulfomarinibacteraceae bacterium]